MLGNQLQQYYEQQANVMVKRFPTAQEIQQRIVETERLLECLKEVHALLEAHPQLERLVGALGKLQQL